MPHMEDDRVDAKDRGDERAPGSGEARPERQTEIPADGEGESQDKPCFVVGIGASAGGQGALEQLFATMPTDCGIAFVVIMHIPPEGPSFLAEMLGRYTAMPAVTAEGGMEVALNRVHVIPAGSDLTLDGGRFRLEKPDAARWSHHPIDRFFQSLALEFKERAVAVVLSGYGLDGAAGAKAVKEAGGIVIVQEPGSALTPAMPKSAIATGAADFVLPAEEIPWKIAEIARGTCALASRKCEIVTLDDELRAIFAIVKGATGHDFSSYKANTVLRRIERRMAVNEVAGIKKYVAFLQVNTKEAHALAQDILIGVTTFFRDPEAFEVLRTTVIPRLFADRNPEDPVRIWHACCATGEEVYSMAFLIREYLDERGIDAKVQFFATDIDEAAISQARAGFYGDGIETEMGKERLKRFFTKAEGRWQVVKQVREMVVFAHHSLIKNPPFSRLDLMVCRNFLIYLTPDMQKRLITLFHQVLKPKGILFLGAAEAVGRHSDLFIPLDKKWKIYERREGGKRGEPLFPFAAPIRFPGTARLQRAEAEEPYPGSLAERLLIERYSPPCVVVNEKYEVVHVSTRTNRFLEVPVGEPTRDILQMAREELRPALRAAVYKAFAEQREVVFRGVKVGSAEGEPTVNVLVVPLDSPRSTGKLVMVLFEPAAPVSLVFPTGGEDIPSGDETSRNMLVHQLEEQLRITNEQLRAVAEQLETSQEGFLTANEELLSMNEEFQSANEELQSTNEELETSKEELQALNEELVTVNAELQGKVEELNEATSDMENLLASSGIATLFLDRQLHIRGFTPAMTRLFDLIPADIGRPFRHLAGKIDWPTLAQDAETVLAGEPFREREVASLQEERCYLKRIFPYRTQEGRIDGIVVTFIDITEHKQAEEHIRHLASFPQLNPNPVLELDLAGNVIFANPATGKTLQTLEMKKEDSAVFIPADLGEVVKGWDKTSDATVHREVAVKERVFGETIFLTPQFDVVRIYAFDITERKKSEEAILRAKEEWERTFDSVPDLIAIMDDRHRIVRANRAMAECLGVTPEECVGRHCYHSVHGADGPAGNCPHALTLADGREHAAEVHEDRLGGDFLVTTTPLLDERGEMIGTVHVAHDITERKRAEDMVRTRLRLSELARHGSIAELIQAALDEMERFTGSSIGFFHFVNEDQKTLTLQAWSTNTLREACQAEGRGMHYPIDRAGVWVDCFRTRSPVIHNDYAGLEHRKGLPEGHVPVMRELVVPVMRGDSVVAIAGVGNKTTDYVQADIDLLQEFASLVMDLAAAKRAEEEREASNEFLRMVNESTATRELIEAAVGFFQRKSECEAVGIRLREGEDYPYYETHGFPEEFVLAETRLCACDEAGRPICDSYGNPLIECMCGNVICGRFDPEKSFFTAKGSFWTNSTTELLASTSEGDRQASTRNRCNGEGYESVALIPLRLGEERLGLLQLNDRQKGRFSPELIALWERLADYLAVALAKFRADEEIARRVEELRASNEELTRFNSASVGRELRMIELKKEVNEFCGQAGLPPRYKVEFGEEQ